MSDDEPELRAEVRRLRANLAALEERLDSVERRLEREAATTDREPEDVETDASGEAPDREASAPKRDVDAAAGDAADAPPPSRSDRSPGAPGEAAAVGEGATGGPTPGADAESDRDWESALGVKWLGIVGVVALVVGVGLFVRYATQQGLIGYFARVVLGALGGVAMVVGGRYASRRPRYERWGRIVTGGGLAITYVSIYAAYGFEAYREAIGVSLGATVALLSLVVAVGAWLSVHDESRVVAAESFLLGYLTAALALGLGPIVLAYALVLTVGLVAVVLRRGWSVLAAGGLAGSYGVYALWTGERTAVTAADGAYLAAVLACYLAVAAAPTLRSMGVDDLLAAPPRRPRLFDLLTAGNALAFALAFDLVARALLPATRPAVFLGLAALYAGVRLAAERTGVETTTGSTPYLCVLFVALAAVVAVGPFWTRLSLAAVLVVLIAGSLSLDRQSFRYAAHGLAIVLVVDAPVTALGGNGLPTLAAAGALSPNRLYAALAVAIAFGLVAATLRTDRSRLATVERWRHCPAWVAYAWVGLAVGAVALAAALDHWFATVAVLMTLVSASVGLSLWSRASLPRYAGYALTAPLVGAVLWAGVDAPSLERGTLAAPNRAYALALAVATGYLLSWALARWRDPCNTPETSTIPSIPVAPAYAGLGTVLAGILLALELSHFWLSAAWASYALVLLGVGFWYGIRHVRLQAVALFGVTTAKVFLLDTSGLDPISRTLSFLTLGAILLVAAFAYARAGDRLADSID